MVKGSPPLAAAETEVEISKIQLEAQEIAGTCMALGHLHHLTRDRPDIGVAGA